jgi:phage shock protein PspC (stress-responsive transcriptional regulator)
MILDVCQRLSEIANFDVTIIRLAFLFGLFFNPPLAISAYLIINFII